MEPAEFIRQAELLTGTDVKGRDQIDVENLSVILREDSKPLSCSHLNELLLLVHKDRVEAPFFDYFFGPDCAVGTLPSGVERFQKTALLLYGNFVFAYRELSRIKEKSEFAAAIAGAARDPTVEVKYFKERKGKLIEVDRIAKGFTPFVGYLSLRDIGSDFLSCELLHSAAKEVGPSGSWAQYEAQVRMMARAEQVAPLLGIVANFGKLTPGASMADWISFLDASLVRLGGLREEVRSVRSRATKNQDIYLTWDHMDVYFATSMRKAWEYEDLFDFIDRLMASGQLEGLGIRYFDPTQAYTANRVNKGLVEALMLKRARCTVYSVQDTDTLGKDSELASTLAQGKPVIAYVPDIEVVERVRQLVAEAPTTILERLRFVLYADEQLSQHLTTEQLSVIDRVQNALLEFASRRIWLSLPDKDAERQFKAGAEPDLEAFCILVARSEKAVYDKRAQTLKDGHPLALQVNLGTGVANGVLVVRTISACAELLRRILLSDMNFSLDEEDGMWYLREQISGCIYRVVTNDRKLNNCFWNFYLR